MRSATILVLLEYLYKGNSTNMAAVDIAHCGLLTDASLAVSVQGKSWRTAAYNSHVCVGASFVTTAIVNSARGYNQ